MRLEIFSSRILEGKGKGGAASVAGRGGGVGGSHSSRISEGGNPGEDLFGVFRDFSVPGPPVLRAGGPAQWGESGVLVNGGTRRSGARFGVRPESGSVRGAARSTWTAREFANPTYGADGGGAGLRSCTPCHRSSPRRRRRASDARTSGHHPDGYPPSRRAPCATRAGSGARPPDTSERPRPRFLRSR